MAGVRCQCPPGAPSGPPAADSAELEFHWGYADRGHAMGPCGRASAQPGFPRLSCASLDKAGWPMPGLTAACGFSLAASLIGKKRGGLRSLLSRCGLARVPHNVPRPRWGERVARRCYAVCAAWCASTFTRAESVCDALQKGGPEVQKRFEEACLAAFRACWMRLAIRMPSCLAGYEAMPRRGARACLVHWSVL